jgi:hypothetical protein
MQEEVRFAIDSPVERDGFETSVPGERAYGLKPLSVAL